jgi:type I restriction enzyme S subunit
MSKLESASVVIPADRKPGSISNEKVYLGEVVTVLRGVSYKKDQAKSAPCSGYLPILRATNIQQSLNFDELVYAPTANINPDQLLRIGDIVVAASSGSKHIVGKAAILENEWKGSFGTFCYALRPNEKVVPKYVAYFLQTSEYRHAISELSSGININNLKREHINGISIPLPPRVIQDRIVEMLDDQTSRLDTAIAALKRAQARLKRYRAAVLKAACEGRLVHSNAKDWRRIKISEIGDAITGNTPPTADKQNLGNELPFFKPTDLDAGYNVREARQYLSAKGVKLARVLPAGSVLVTCIGATIGKTGFARVSCATNQQINALVVNPEIATPEWAFWWFNSPDGQKQIKDNASATTLPILNKSKFEALEILIPSVIDQRLIVGEVEQRLSVSEKLEASVAANLGRASRLRQAILKRAFEGRLAGNDIRGPNTVKEAVT